MTNPNEDILVSILIACYNGENFIYNCLSSCINQTYKNIEIIIINDGSTDNSKEIFEWWTNRDQRIRVINNINQGLGETRNLLIKESKGQYFTFLDVDDILSEDSIEKFVNEVKYGGYDIVVGRTNLLYESRVFYKIPFIPAWRIVKNMTNNHYVKSNICTPWASLIRTDFFRSLDVKFIKGRVFEDFGVMSYVFLKAKKFKAIKDIVYYYQRHKRSKKNENLSSFKTSCFKKTNDIYWQINQLMNYLYNNDLLKTRKQKRSINGVLFQILPSNIFLSSNLTRNKYYRYLINYDLVKMIASFGMHIKFSKTFWKSLTFFYINYKNFRVLKHITKKKKWDFFINGSLKKNTNGYALISLDNKIRRPSRKKIYDVSMENILKHNIDGNSVNTNISLSINDWNEEQVKKAISIMHKFNAVPFATIRTNELNENNIKYLKEETLGIIIDLRYVDLNYCESIIKIYESTIRERIIYIVISKKEEQKIEHLKSKINGVFWDE